MRHASLVFTVLSFLTTLVFMGTVATAQDQGLSDPLIRIGQPGRIHSEVLDEERQYWIHLPEGYSERGDKAYPVIYLLDGEEHLAGLAAIQNYYNFFRLPEMIVVGISNSTHRSRDLTPTVISSRNGAGFGESGGADTFRAFLSRELIPHIDATYSTTPHRVLIGHSFGGLFVVDTLVKESDLFTNYIALDPSLDWDEGRWIQDSLDRLPGLSLEGHSLFLAVANEIIRFSDTLTLETVRTDTSPFSLGIRSAISFAQAQEELSNGLAFSWKFYEKDIHGSVALPGMRDALVGIYDFWELKKPSLYNDPDTPIDTILSLIREQSRAREAGMGYPLPMELELLDMLAHFYADTGQLAKARGVLSLTAEYYPSDASLHESLVEVCVGLEDVSCARNHAAKADELRGTTEQQDRVRSVFGNSN